MLMMTERRLDESAQSLSGFPEYGGTQIPYPSEEYIHRTAEEEMATGTIVLHLLESKDTCDYYSRYNRHLAMIQAHR